jgi:small subunit ribosomal protein S20
LANHKSAIKKARMSLRRNAINSKTMSEVRTVEKKLRKALGAKSKDDATKTLAEFMSVISKAAQKGRMKKETASRRVARVSAQIAALK